MVEQAKGYLREHFDISVEDAFTLLRRYAHTDGGHFTDVCRRLISDPPARQNILAALANATSPVLPHRDHLGENG